MTTADFDDDDLPERLDAMDDAQRDALAFGVIRLDAHERVTYYSRTEAQQSGRGQQRPTLGLAFFEQVAPCMAGDAFRGRIEEARRQGWLDLELGHTGDFADPARRLQVRAMSEAGGGLWLAIRRS